MNTESDTPRTDEVAEGYWYSEMLNHARQLERELNEVNKQRDDLMTMLEKIAGIAEQVDSWESFPSDPIEQAYDLMQSIKQTNKIK